MMNEYIQHLKEEQTVEKTIKPVEKPEKKVDNYTFIPGATPAKAQPKPVSQMVLDELNKTDRLIQYADQVTENL